MTDWQISESGATVVLNERGQATVTFTVTNPGPDSDRAVLTISPLDEAEREWFRVEEPQRDVGPGDSAVWVVELEVRDGTPAGTYAFQGVVYSADRDPGESSATSKRVTFEVAPQEEKSAFPWWIAAVVLAVVVLIAAIIWFMTRGEPPENVAPPEISGPELVLGTLEATEGIWEDADVIELRWERCEPLGPQPTLGPIPGEVEGFESDGLDLGLQPSGPATGSAIAAVDFSPTQFQGRIVCEEIPGAVGATYTVTQGELGLQLRVVATATNSEGSTSVASDLTAEIGQLIIS